MTTTVTETGPALSTAILPLPVVLKSLTDSPPMLVANSLLPCVLSIRLMMDPRVSSVSLYTVLSITEFELLNVAALPKLVPAPGSIS